MQTTGLRSSGKLTQGFSLVELVAAACIISLLAALVLPSLGRGAKLAKGAQCAGNIHEIAQALINFRADNNGLVIPPATQGQDYQPEWVLETYLGSGSGNGVQSRVWNCPANPALPAGGTQAGYDGAGVSYAVNGQLLGDTVGQFNRQASMFLVLERNTANANARGTSVNRDTYYVSRGGYYGHPQGQSVAFMDGHVKPLPRTHPALEGTATSGTSWMPYWQP